MLARKRRVVFLLLGSLLLFASFSPFFRDILRSESDNLALTIDTRGDGFKRESTLSSEDATKLHELREKASKTDWKSIPRHLATNSEEKHEKWIVVTSISEPTEDIKHLANIDGWKLVVVGDTKTPEGWSHPNVVFLSIKDQEQLGYKTTAFIPYKCYARKTIGHLYAIQHGAKIIYETDDDNHPSNGRIEFHEQDRGRFLMFDTKSAVVNPYSYFGQSSMWPRGYPLNRISQPLTDQQRFIMCDSVRPLVQQGVVDGDPDVDAIFRLTRKDSEARVDVKFDSTAPPVALPPGTMTPYNSQNTVTLYDALWSLPFGSTTTFRVTDIWRSYWAQRLLWEIGGYLAYFGPNAIQFRSPHDLYDDFILEKDLYHKAGSLVHFLIGWESRKPEFFSRVMDLTIAMVEEGFWGVQDAEMIYAWLTDLASMGYQIPKVRPLTRACDSIVSGGGVILPKEQPSSYLRTGQNLEDIISKYSNIVNNNLPVQRLSES